MKRNLLVGLFVLLICFNFIAWRAVFESFQFPVLEVVFFDVGQGDAIFIKSPQGHQVLIDGGSNAKILEKLAQVMPFYDKSLDLVILSHPEKDHMGGLIEVLKRYKVDYVLWTGIRRETPEFEEWLKSLNKEGARVKIAQAGQKIVVSGVILDIFHPFESLKGKKFKDSNNTSIVSKLSFGRNSFLLTGDIYQSKERKMIEKGFSLDSEVLKIAHHGSKTSTCKEFLEAVSPKIAVISVGERNPYRHPSWQVLTRLTEFGTQILRTDEKGDIKFESDGKNLKISLDK